MSTVLPWLSLACMVLGTEPAGVPVDEPATSEVDEVQAPAPTPAPEPTEDSPVAEPPPPEPVVPPAAAVRAQRAFQAEQWDEAIEALMEAYAADPDPAYLYARAQAERMRGNCPVAVALYRRFLETGPSERQRADTERHVRLCEEILFNERAEAERAETETEAESAEAEPLPPPTAPDDEPRDRPRRARPRLRDPLGWSLVAGGGAVAAVGATVWGLGQRDLRRAPNAPTEDEYERRVSEGRQRTIVGVSAAGIGVAAVVGGIVRLALVARGSRVSTAAWWTPSSTGVGVRARF